MLMSAPFASTFAAGLVLFGMTYTANSVLNALIRRALARKAAQTDAEDSLTEA